MALLTSTRSPVWTFLAIITAWIVLGSQVRHHWGGESYYNFGWFVPFLALWLLVRNFTRVPPDPQHRHPAATLFLAACCLLPLIPFHALAEVNPFWRVPLWVQALGCAAFSFLLLYQLYGWRGLRAAVFPLFFLSTMVPWPFRMELAIVQGLTGIVVDLSVAGLHFLGFPVEVAGNSLVLDDMSIGVNEACSGIRSLQALFMVTLFLGSLFGQGPLRRLLAILFLPVVVIIVNAGRAIYLAQQVIINGEDAYNRLHDPAGYVAFGISMLLIYITIELCNIGSKGERQSQEIYLRSHIEAWRKASAPRLAVLYPILPIALFLSVESWFLYHESTAGQRKGWAFQLPDDSNPRFQYRDVHSSISEALGYSYGYNLLHAMPAGNGMEIYYYGYEEDNKLASVSSYGHSPAICMEAVGAVMLRQFDDLLIRRGNLTIPVSHYLFKLPDNGQRLHVFWIVYEYRNMDIAPEDLAELNYKTQWIQLLRGRRDFSRKVLLTSLHGIDDTEQARRVMRRFLTERIEPYAH